MAPSQSRHRSVDPSQNAEVLQVDQSAVGAWLGHALDESLLKDRRGRRCGRLLGGADVVRDPSEHDLALTLMGLLDGATGQMPCAHLAVVAPYRPDRLMFVPRMRADEYR